VLEVPLHPFDVRLGLLDALQDLPGGSPKLVLVIFSEAAELKFTKYENFP